MSGSTYTLNIEVNGDDNASPMLLNLDGSISGLGIAAATALGGMAKDAFETAAGAVISFGKDALGVAMDYQGNLNMFQAVSGATADQMLQVAQRAKDLGADMSLPATSAGDAALAMTELAKAGLSVTDSMAAAKGVLQMSAAGGVDNARAAEIAANALNAFNLKGTEATRVADLLAAAANASSAEVSDIADSLQQASAVAAGAGIPIEQVTAAIAEMANKGIKGSDAGTSIKQMLLSLQAPSNKAADLMRDLGISVYDADGKMRPFPDLIKQFSESLADGSKRAAPMPEELDKLGKAAKKAQESLPDLVRDYGFLHDKLMIANTALQQATEKYGAGSVQAQKAKLAVDQLAASMDDQKQKIDQAKGVTDSYAAMQKAATGATITMTQAQRDQALATIFGSDASRAARIIMLGGVDAFNQTTEAVTRQGAASDLAGARMKGLGGAWEGLKSTWETLQLALAEPLLEPLEGGVRAVADAINAAQPALISFVQTYLVPAAQGLASFLQGFVQAPDKIGFLQTALANAVSYVASALPGWITKLGEWSLAAATWILNAIPGMLSNAGTMSSSLLDALGRAIPAIVAALGGWAASFASWAGPAVPGMLDSALGLLNSLGTWITDRAPIIGGYLASWATNFASWASDVWPGTRAGLIVMLDHLTNWALDSIPRIATTLYKWGEAFVGFVAPYIPKVLTALGDLYADVAAWVIGKLPMVQAKFAEWGAALSEWVKTEGWPKLQANLAVMWSDFSAWIGQKVAAAQADGSIGRALVDGIKFGISAAWSGFTGWMASQWNDFIRGVKYVLGINSPSTVFAEIGGYLMDGLRNGLNAAWGTLTQLATNIGMSIKDKLNEWWGAFKDVGTNLVSGLWRGIQDSWQSTLVGPLRTLAEQLPEPIRRALGIASPSKLFAAEIGQWIFPGVVQGAEATLPQAGRDLSQLTGQLPGLAMPSLGLSSNAALGGGSTGGSVTNVYVTVPVQGSMVTERDLIASVIDGVRVASRQNGGLAAMGVAL